jgi:hypothetical protein
MLHISMSAHENHVHGLRHDGVAVQHVGCWPPTIGVFVPTGLEVSNRKHTKIGHAHHAGHLLQWF